LPRTLKRPSLARDFSDLGIVGGILLDSAAKIGNRVWGSGF